MKAKHFAHSWPFVKAFLGSVILPPVGGSLILTHRASPPWQIFLAGVLAAGLVGIGYRLVKAARSKPADPASQETYFRLQGALVGYLVGVALALYLWSAKIQSGPM